MAPERPQRPALAAVIGLGLLGVGLLVAGLLVAGLAWGPGADPASALVWKLRLVRGLAALLVGACLAVSGAVLQGVMRNDLVEPGLLGINAGGNLAAMVAMLWVPGLALTSPGSMALVSWSGALGACLLVLLLGRGPGGYRPTQLLLTGVGVGAIVSALSVPISMLAPVDTLFFNAVHRREIGALQSADWGTVAVLAAAFGVLGVAARALAHSIDVLNLGESVAQGLGLRVGRVRLQALAVAAGLAGACVAVGGGMAFVGLLGPHIGRRLVGPRLARLLPAAALAGGLLVLAADLLGKHLLSQSEIPAGLLVGVIGAPYLLFLLMR